MVLIIVLICFSFFFFLFKSNHLRKDLSRMHSRSNELSLFHGYDSEYFFTLSVHIELNFLRKYACSLNGQWICRYIYSILNKIVKDIVNEEKKIVYPQFFSYTSVQVSL